MNIFIILYLFVIIIALMLILFLSSKKEQYATRTSPFSLKCNLKQVKTESVKPILYYI